MNNYRVKLSNTLNNFKVSVIPGGPMVPAAFEDLINFDYTNKSDKYVIMYDSSTQKYKLVNPDEVLSASSNTETTQPGLPNDFVNTLDVDLDNKIDLDAGNF
jgi:hypothetical protein